MTKILGIGGLALLMLSSCKKDGALVVEGTATGGALTASATTLVLNSANLTSTSTVMTFSFTKPSFGFPAGVNNTLQIDAAADNWANPYTIALNNGVLSQGFNTADFNNILLKLGLKGGVAAGVNVRISSSIGSSVTPTYSNVVALTVTPFNLKSWLYVAGAYEGWANPGPMEDSLYSATSNGIYVGIINFTAGNNQFLILPKKNWDNKYATSNSTVPSTVVGYNGGNNTYNTNFSAPTTPGQYIVTLNLNTNTISFALANYYSLIGSSTPGTAWSTDTDMKYINDGTSTWTATVPMTVGAFKIRENHDWTYSWGDISPANGTDATDNNGGNINITTAKNYTVTFTIPLTAQAPGFTPSVTATYSVK